MSLAPDSDLVDRMIPPNRGIAMRPASNRPGSQPAGDGSAAAGQRAPQGTGSAPTAQPEIRAIRGTPHYRKISTALFLAGFSTFSLLYSVQPLLPEFAADFHLNAATSSLALSLSTGFLAFAILCAGPVSEAVGRRGLMFVAMAAAALCNILVGFAPNWTSILVLRSIEGLVLGGVPAVAMTYLSEEIELKSLGLAMGLYISGNAFGGVFGRVAEGIMTDLVGWRIAASTLGVVALLTAFGFIALLPPSRNFTRRVQFNPSFHLNAWRMHLRHPVLPFLFAIGGLVMGAFVAIYNYAGFTLQQPPFSLNQTQSSLLFTAYVFGICASSVAGALADKIGRTKVLLSGLGFAIAGIAVTLLDSVAAMAVGVSLLTIGFFVAHSVASSSVGRHATTAKGHASSLYLLSYYLGSSIIGSVGGWFWAQGGWTMLGAFGIALLLLALGCALALHHRQRKIARETTR